ncbi:MAG: hypothetical protein MR215_04640 [Bacteroidales bacterium]|nr:hypothetical protein [Bacteroidales bacterium]MDD7725757.1 hypothetical protein [Bacteroidales bacterium]
MIHILLILFIITLFYFAIANRLMTYVSILTIQGLLICVAAVLTLNQITVANLATIILETLVVKAILMPYFIRKVILTNNITREAEPSVPNYVSLLFCTLVVVASYFTSLSIASPTLNKFFLVAALAGIFCGLYFIATRRKVITHVICYVIIENGAFILSLAIGNEMPVLVNLGVILDVLVSVFLLVIFINKVGDVTSEGDVTGLNQLKD